MTNYLPTT